MEKKTAGKFGARVQELMRTHKPPLMYTDLAQATGKHYEHIRKVVHGYAWPSDDLLESLAEALGTTVMDLKESVVTDQIVRRYGPSSYKHLFKQDVDPEFMALQPTWQRLKPHQKDTLRQMFAMYDAENRKDSQFSGLALSPLRQAKGTHVVPKRKKAMRH